MKDVQRRGWFLLFQNVKQQKEFVLSFNLFVVYLIMVVERETNILFFFGLASQDLFFQVKIMICDVAKILQAGIIK